MTRYCTFCAREMPVWRARFSMTSLLLTIVTCGLWLPVGLAMAFTRRPKLVYCKRCKTICGEVLVVGPFGGRVIDEGPGGRSKPQRRGATKHRQRAQDFQAERERNLERLDRQRQAQQSAPPSQSERRAAKQAAKRYRREDPLAERERQRQEQADPATRLERHRREQRQLEEEGRRLFEQAK